MPASMHTTPTSSTSPTSSDAMASALNRPSIDPEKLASFSQHLRDSTYILALVGAGMSAPSGLLTFRGAGGHWRTHDATELATREAFSRNPGLVWQFYSHRRHLALEAKPNAAHYALAELARTRGGFLTLSQNVDGLSARAGHPHLQLQLLHGSLFDVKCTAFYCKFSGKDFSDPIVPALAIPTVSSANAIPSVENLVYDPTRNGVPTTNAVSNGNSARGNYHHPFTNHMYDSRNDDIPAYLDISNPSTPLPSLAVSDLPHCPTCGNGLLRPGVVWTDEPLPRHTISTIDDWIAQAPNIDLMIVVGTSAQVRPAADYIQVARDKGARVAVVNLNRDDVPGGCIRKQDWFFEGDAAVIMPEILRAGMTSHEEAQHERRGERNYR